MKKLILIILAIVLFVGITGVYGITKVVEIPVPEAIVIGVEGEAKIKDGNTWQALTVDTKLKEGDTIKTGNNGLVEINFYDNSFSRVGADAEITLENLYIDENDHNQSNVSIMVGIGRVWSRILQLTDKDASFEVTSNSTVATVRGTSFDFLVQKNGSTDVSTTESVVAVAAIKISEEVDRTAGQKKKIKEVMKNIQVREGMSARINKNDILNDEVNEKIKVGITPAKIKNSEWLKSSLEEGERFKLEIEKKKEDLNKKIAGILPGGVGYNLKKLAEGTRLALTFNENKKTDLKANFLNRRLAEAGELVGQGKGVLAEKTIDGLNKNVRDVFGGEGGFSKDQILNIKNKMRSQFNVERNILGDITPNQSMHDLKIMLEEWGLNNLFDDGDKEYMEFSQLQERLRELKNLKEQGKIDEFNKYIKMHKDDFSKYLNEASLVENLGIKRDLLLGVVEENLRNFEDVINDGMKNLEGAELKNGLGIIDNTFDNTEDGLKDFESSINEQLPLQREPIKATEPTTVIEPMPTVITEPVASEPIVNEPIVDESLANEVEPIIEDTLTTEPIVSESEIIEPILQPVTLVGLVVTSPRVNVTAGQTIQFSAMANYSDDTQKDVSGTCSWRVSGDVGTISSTGLLQTDPVGGQGTVNAACQVDGQALNATSENITALPLMILN